METSYSPQFHYVSPKSWLRRLNLGLSDIATLIAVAVIVIISAYLMTHASPAYAGTVSLPGDDASDKLEAAGTLLKVIDTGVFKWGARIFAGLCVLSAGWGLKEQRFGFAIICVLGALIIGTAPMWVRNIFDIGGNQSLFSSASPELYPSGTLNLQPQGGLLSRA